MLSKENVIYYAENISSKELEILIKELNNILEGRGEHDTIFEAVLKKDVRGGEVK